MCPFIPGHRLYLSKFKHKMLNLLFVSVRRAQIYLFFELSLGPPS